ncbi:MAG TPA: IPT/TIG domain-containing protein [Candidatus Acidoferrales bacterium]|nr:IPT/TIG domain-containing protein [Candidatus Acidoferrales bacterium]
MKWRRYACAAAATALAGLLAACGKSSTPTTITVSPSAAVVVLGGTQPFTAGVSGNSNTGVNWSLSGTGCSGTACGTISTSGIYTAPTTIPTPNTVTVTATSQAVTTATATATVTLDSGVRVQVTPSSATVGTNETIILSATVTGTTNTGVTWTVGGTANGSSSVGQICQVGSNPCAAPTGPVNTVAFLAPASAPASSPVDVAAVSVADSTQQATVPVSIFAQVAPVVSTISPSSAAQGAVSQDVYINTQSPAIFFSTSTVLANGTPIPTTFISTALIRGRVPAAVLQSAGAVQISVQEQNGVTSNTVGLQVGPVRPAIVSLSPISLPQCPTASCGPAAITLEGGYFSPSTQVQFNGQTVGAKLVNPNQLSVAIPGSALAAAGLYGLTVTNPGATEPEAAVNVAVEPNVSSNPPAIVATVGVGTQPSAVAVDSATGVAVVANSGANTISLLDLNNCTSSSCPVTNLAVGRTPTGVAVDPLRNLAIVVNQADNTLSLVDLSGRNPTQTVSLPASATSNGPSGNTTVNLVPVAIGENPLTGHALVANQATNIVTVVDLSQNPPVITPVDVTQDQTRSGGTGLQPRVAIEPQLDWAVVTPGGSGAISAVDMSHPSTDAGTGKPTFNLIFSFVLSTSVEGISLNPVTDQLLLADPNGSTAAIFSLLDESVTPVRNVGFNNGASAVNPLTNVGVLANQATNSVSLVDLGTGLTPGLSFPVGKTPVDIAVDAVSNEAVVVNQGDNTISVLSLGAARPLNIIQAGPSRLFTSGSAQQVTLLGGGFAAGAAVRVDGTPLPSADVQIVNSRQMNVTLPASLLGGPRLLNLDVENPGSTLSNIDQVQVVQAISVGTAPIAVALDHDLNMVVVTNSGSNSVSLVNLATGTVTSTVTVGVNPQSVAVIPRLGLAVVANAGDNTASIVNLATATASTAQLGATQGSAQDPVAVDINQDTAVAAVANEQSNSVSLVDATTGTLNTQVIVDTGPLGVSIDPNLGVAAVLAATQNPPLVDLVDLKAQPPGLTGHVFGPNLPIGVALDPVNDLFLVADSSGNRIEVINPVSNSVVQNVATGINPTAITYNFQAQEAVTVNVASHTASVIEITPNGSQVRALVPVDGSNQQSVVINSVANVAVVADQAHNRILVVPLPH